MSKRRNRRGDVTRKGMQLAWAIAEHERIREENERVTGMHSHYRIPVETIRKADRQWATPSASYIMMPAS